MSMWTSRNGKSLLARCVASALTAATLVGTAGVAGAAAPPTSDGSTDATGCAPRPLPERASLKVSVPGLIEGMANVLLADELGEFERENLDVEILSMPSGDALPQLAGGDIDFALTSMSAPFFNALSQGYDIKMVAPLFSSSGRSAEGLYVRNDLVDGGPAALSGGAIATFAGLTGNNVLVIGDYLAEGGVEISDVSGIRLPAEAQVAALESDEVVAAWVNAPVPPGLEDVATRVLTWTDDEVLAGIVAGPSMLDGDPAVVESFLCAVARTVSSALQGDYYSDPDVVAAMAAATGSPPEAFVPGSELVWNTEMELYTPDPVERLQTYLGQVPDLLVYEEPIPYDQLIDTSYLATLGFG